MSALFKEVHAIPVNVKDLVFGYIRQHQVKLLHDRIVAPLISHLCLFFYHIKEFWTAYDAEIHHVNDAKDIMTNIVKQDDDSYPRGTVYGNVQTDPSFVGIYRWTFKILEAPSGVQLYIGIDASNKKYLADDYSDPFPVEPNTGFKHYAFGDGNKYSMQTEEEQYGTAKMSASGFWADDVVEMELNTLAKSIKLIINGEDQGIAFDDVDVTVQYHMAVTSSISGASVQILNFQQVFMQ